MEAERAEYLLAHYAIHTIQVKPYDFASQARRARRRLLRRTRTQHARTQAGLLDALCREGWSQPAGLSFVGCEYSLSWDAPDTGAQLCSLRATPLDVPAGVVLDIRRLAGRGADRFVALGINLGRTARGALIGGGMLYECRKFAKLTPSGSHHPFATGDAVLPRAAKCDLVTSEMKAAGACRVDSGRESVPEAPRRHRFVLLRERVG